MYRSINTWDADWTQLSHSYCKLDHQLTIMILVLDIFTYIPLFPPTLMGFISFDPSVSQDALAQAQFQLANTFLEHIYELIGLNWFLLRDQKEWSKKGKSRD